MAIDFDALDLIRTKNKAKMYEQKQKEKKDKLETIKDTRAKIKSGEYKLTDLNSKPVYEDTVETINLNK